MKRKCYAKDHVTVRLTFEEFSVLTSAINFDIVSTCRNLDDLDQSNVLTKDYEHFCKHRLSVLRSLNDIFPINA